jgi:ABC-type dipeptide/oligopeptide/nickel transport system ATPase component
MNEPLVLAADDVSISFRSKGKPDRRVVHHVSLQMQRAQVTVLLGESGSGKTVFARSIAGLAPRGAKTSGTSTFDGRDLLTEDAASLRGLHGDRIGSVAQDPSSALDPMRRVGGQVVETLIQHGKSANRAAATARMFELLDLVHIREPQRVARCYPHELSGGMRQRIAIAIAVSCNPELVIADEPSSALDASVGVRVVELLGDLRDRFGTSILFITHDIGIAARIAKQPRDRVAVMLAGRLVEIGTAAQVFENPLHAYTRALIAAEPSGDVLRGQLAVVPDSVRSQKRWGDLVEVDPGHSVAHPVGEEEAA